MSHRIPVSPDILATYCERHHIRRLALFGSSIKGQRRPDSDIDLLVEFEPGREPGFIGLAGMEIELSELMGGVQVDLRTPRDLSRYFRDEVMAEAEIQYAACRTHGCLHGSGRVSPRIP